MKKIREVISIRSFVFNPLQENTYLLFDDTKDCIVIDPGCYENHEKEELSDFIKENGLKVTKLINTHCHFDHVLGNQFVKERFTVKLFIGALEEQVFLAVKAYAPNYGFFQYQEAQVDGYLKEHDTISFGNSSLEILFVPGHSPGHLAFYNAEQHFVIAGDVLFKGSIGRTDLPLGDYNTLVASIKNKMYKLPDETTVYPGHGPETTIGSEKKFNPFVRE